MSLTSGGAAWKRAGMRNPRAWGRLCGFVLVLAAGISRILTRAFLLVLVLAAGALFLPPDTSAYKLVPREAQKIEDPVDLSNRSVVELWYDLCLCLDSGGTDRQKD